MCRKPNNPPVMLIFMSADCGRIRVENWGDYFPGVQYPSFATPDEVAAFLIKHNIDSWINSSSMDFGTEYGFEFDNVRGAILTEVRRLKAEAAL